MRVTLAPQCLLINTCASTLHTRLSLNVWHFLVRHESLLACCSFPRLPSWFNLHIPQMCIPCVSAILLDEVFRLGCVVTLPTITSHSLVEVFIMHLWKHSLLLVEYTGAFLQWQSKFFRLDIHMVIKSSVGLNVVKYFCPLSFVFFIDCIYVTAVQVCLGCILNW